MQSSFRSILGLMFAVLCIVILAIYTGPDVGRYLIEIFVIGEVPGTDIEIEFESLFAGVIFFAWVSTTYFFAISAMVHIGRVLELQQSSHESSQREIEEIAL